ncbi:hypothetical protein NUW54_g12644 [Trametes sanguinea]|uniref:Uncharacterized protein n=1 Tax=Trametes sanguinea TaxID=158606 RepID=A0ACC1MX53_9APHY|nr:hypothetical protein NUW54_g12644 [Trametes sanguinea]
MLRCSGFPSTPRRIIDINQNLYLVGYRYYCGHQDCGKIFASWSPAVLSALPPPLAAEFTFVLSRRNGITDQLAALLRSSFQRGLGPDPFAKMIRTFHIRRYEQLYSQYLELVKTRIPMVRTGFLSLHADFSDWEDLSGYAGFVPTQGYFRSIYNTLIEQHAQEFDQYSAMLPATIICADHSHKVPKHLIKVNGEQVFSALHTVVNEYGECRSMTLTPTKAHDQFMPLLARIPHSLRLYGHNDIQLVFTDNVRADKPELERVFPSLLKDLTPIPSSSLQALALPPTWEVTILGSSYQVNNRVNGIMDDLSGSPDEERLHIAMDMEWSVDRASGIHGRVALVTFVYHETIFLIPLATYLRDDGLHLPHMLLVMLRSPRVKKYGVSIKGDFTRLYNDCSFAADEDAPGFDGAVELGDKAQRRGLVSHANVGLAELVSLTLRRHLPVELGC